MSLYDGLDIDTKSHIGRSNKSDVAGWGSSLKLLETQKILQEKKMSSQNGKRKPATISLAPVIDLKGRKNDSESFGMRRFNQATGKMEWVSIIGSPFIGSDALLSFLGVIDEYDPLRPNDYETFRKLRKEEKRERDEERRTDDKDKDSRRSRHSDDRDHHGDWNDRRRDEEGDSFRRSRSSSWKNSDDDAHSRRRGQDENGEFERRRRRRAEEDEEDEEDHRRRPSAPKAAIAPPPSLMDLDVKPTEDFQGPVLNKPDSDLGAKFGLGGSVASKIMARMGYREGQGLGREGQGMSTALQVEKMGKRGGKIIHEKDLQKAAAQETASNAPRAELSNANLLRNPSKVIILRNMVGPGEVDPELEGETAEECAKYGKVIKCVIFEVPDGPDEEAVRIFIEFERMESAIKAVVDLNGRYFGGRVVKGNFYDLEKFHQLDLGDEVE